MNHELLNHENNTKMPPRSFDELTTRFMNGIGESTLLCEVTFKLKQIKNGAALDKE